MAIAWPAAGALAGLVAVHAGLALVLGGWHSDRWTSRHAGPWADAQRLRARTARRAGAGLGLSGLLLSLWSQAAAMGDVPMSQAMPTLVVLVQRTHYGHVALAGLAAWALAGVAAGRPARGQGGAAAAMAALALLTVAWSRAAVSHAAQAGDVSVDVAVDVLHQLAAGTWVGIVWAAAALRLPDEREPAAGPAADRAAAGAWVSSLSATATVALVLVAATGLFKSWRALGTDVGTAIASGYGQLLAWKLAGVAAAALLGAHDRFRVLPGLLSGLRGTATVLRSRPSTSARLRAVLRVQAGVLLLVLVAAALLSGTEPPG